LPLAVTRKVGDSANNSFEGGQGDDNLDGGAGNDTLDGGDGADILKGGDGTDTFYTGLGADNVDGGTGTLDIVYYNRSTTAVSVNLTTNINTGGEAQGDILANVERVYATNFDDNITGDANANYLYGVNGNDTLNGMAGNDLLYGGLGNDTLTGGTGLDSFVFNSVINASTNSDTITDFTVVDDTIQLDNAVMAAIFSTTAGTTGLLNSGQFVIGAAAVDANDFITYNSTTGVLSYDADGNGAGAAVKIATVSTGLALTFNDFTVI
jgi:Ca2+-binding RTX toxin-like protein